MAEGEYFTFNRTQLRTLERSSSLTLEVTNYRTQQTGIVRVWGDSEGINHGFAHGRYDNNPIASAKGQWVHGDFLTIHDPNVCPGNASLNLF